MYEKGEEDEWIGRGKRSEVGVDGGGLEGSGSAWERMRMWRSGLGGGGGVDAAEDTCMERMSR